MSLTQFCVLVRTSTCSSSMADPTPDATATAPAPTASAEEEIKQMWQGEVDEMKNGQDEVDEFALTVSREAGKTVAVYFFATFSAKRFSLLPFGFEVKP